MACTLPKKKGKPTIKSERIMGVASTPAANRAAGEVTPAPSATQRMQTSLTASATRGEAKSGGEMRRRMHNHGGNYEAGLTKSTSESPDSNGDDSSSSSTNQSNEADVPGRDKSSDAGGRNDKAKSSDEAQQRR